MEVASPRPIRPINLDSGESSMKSAFDAEKEARDRIAGAHRMAEDAEREAAARANQVRDDFENQSAVTSARHAQLYEDQQTRGYQAIRELQLKQQAELARVRRQSEKELEDLRAHYKAEMARVDRDGNSSLEESTRRHHHTFLSEDLRAKIEAELQKREFELQAQAQKEVQDTRLAQMEERYANEFAKVKEATETEQAGMDDHFKEKMDSIRNAYDDSLERTLQQAKESLYDLQHANLSSLNAYRSREEDPFYRTRSMDTQFDETDGAYILRAQIPEHEAGQVSAMIQGHQLVLAGTRRSADTIQEEPGRTISTHSYQTFRETFPLRQTVDAKGLYKHYEDGVLTVILPKVTDKMSFDELIAPLKPNRSTLSEADSKKLKADRPQYPRTLAVTEADKSRASSELGDRPAPQPSGPTHGSKVMGVES